MGVSRAIECGALGSFLLCLVKVKDIILAFLCIVVCKSACSSGEKSLLANLSEGGANSETREERVHGNGKYEDVVFCHLSGTVSFISIRCIGNTMGNRGTTFISRKALVGSSAFFFFHQSATANGTSLGDRAYESTTSCTLKRKWIPSLVMLPMRSSSAWYQVNKPDLTCGGKGGVKSRDSRNTGIAIVLLRVCCYVVMGTACIHVMRVCCFLSHSSPLFPM